MMKQSLLALTLAGITIAATSAIAQDASGNAQPPAGAPPAGEMDHGGRRHFDPAERTQMLTKHLKLTADQQPKVLEILKSEQSQMESLRSDTSTSREDKRSKMMDIHKASDDQINALLDANQQKKFAEMQARREHWQGRRGAGNGAPPPPPSDSDQK